MALAAESKIAEPGITLIEPSELLYRATPDKTVWIEAGKFFVGPEAFRDPANRPSVDRAGLRDFNPDLTRDYVWRDKSKPDYGIVSLWISQVRGLSPLPQVSDRGEAIDGPHVDAEHVPLEDNYAYSEIFGTPHIEKRNLFRRLKVSLAEEAEKNQTGVLLPRTS